MPLPEISFADERADVIESELVAAYESATGKTLYPADPVRLFLAVLAYRLAVQNAVINLAARQNLLAFATGAHLDHLGDLMGVKRIEAQPARVMLRYSLQEALDFTVTVPSGSRSATRDGSAVFQTSSAADIAPGELSVDVPAEAVEGGSRANGLVPGQICEMIDPVAWIASVSSISPSTGGNDPEDDERLRERIRLAPESYSCAGSEGAYRAHVLAVSPDIEDVVIHSPVPGTVDVRFVLTGGELPDEAIIALVQEALSGETVRPLTDTVTVSAPDTVSYSVKGRWFLGRSQAELLSFVTQAVGEALETYRLWQRARPGRDINPTKLISLVEQAGAKRIELESPSFTILDNVQVARELSLELTFGGLEDD